MNQSRARLLRAIEFRAVLCGLSELLFAGVQFSFRLFNALQLFFFMLAQSFDFSV